MKKCTLFLFIAIIVLSISCSKNHRAETIDNYYVKYEASVTHINKTIGKLEVKVVTPEGVSTFVGGTTFNQTFGPFTKGTTVNIISRDISSSASYSSPTTIVTIYVSKNTEPFALKITNSGSLSASASYTID